MTLTSNISWILTEGVWGFFSGKPQCFVTWESLSCLYKLMQDVTWYSSALNVCERFGGWHLSVTCLHVAKWEHLYFLRRVTYLCVPRPNPAATLCCSVCPVMKRGAFHISFFCNHMKWTFLTCKGEEPLFSPCFRTENNSLMSSSLPVLLYFPTWMLSSPNSNFLFSFST